AVVGTAGASTQRDAGPQQPGVIGVVVGGVQDYACGFALRGHRPDGRQPGHRPTGVEVELAFPFVHHGGCVRIVRHPCWMPGHALDKPGPAPQDRAASDVASHANPSGSVNGSAAPVITIRCDPVPSGATPASLASARRRYRASLTGPAPANSTYIRP